MHAHHQKLVGEPSAALYAWLRRQILAATASHAIAGIITGTLGCLALIATFYAIYTAGFMLFARGRGLAQLLDFNSRGPTHQFLLAVTLVLVVLLFVTFFFRDREGGQRPFAFKGKNVAQSISTLLVDVLYVAPQLFKVAFDFLSKSVRLALIDIHACSSILSVLAEHSGRLSYTSIINALNLQQSVRAFRDVSLLDGVVVLASEPSGLSLTADLREEIAAVVGVKAPSSSSSETLQCPGCGFLLLLGSINLDERSQCSRCGTGYRVREDLKGHRFVDADEQPRPSEADDELAWCCRILGIRLTTGADEARKAYRRLIKENHPDLVYGLGTELEHIAVEKSKEINAAYEIFVGRIGNRKSV
jgi:hypothetical protein